MKMDSLLLRSALVGGLAVGAVGAQAASSLGEGLSFSGFGTVGLARTDTSSAQFKRDRQPAGADTSPSATVDSDLGLQVSATLTPWLSATGQMLSISRDKKSIDTQVEWAFVKAVPVDGLSIRGGRMGLPLFMVSDSRNLGYANNWLRAPGEVYGLAQLSRLDGADVSYSHPIGSTTLTATVLGGKSQIDQPLQPHYNVRGVKGVNVLWETEWATVRVGKLKATVHVNELDVDDSYTFSGAGVTVDRDNIFAQAEYVQRRSSGQGPIVDSNGWYLMGGYRMNGWMPYGIFGSTRPRVTDAPFHVSGWQKTEALGVRWDFAKSADLKVQLERIDTKGSAGVSFTAPVAKPVTATSVVVDFVF